MRFTRCIFTAEAQRAWRLRREKMKDRWLCFSLFSALPPCSLRLCGEAMFARLKIEAEYGRNTDESRT
jgi:hypothetical protein